MSLRILLGALVLAAGPAAAEDIKHAQRRAAFHQWNAGVGYVLENEEENARQAWEACLRLDPENLDCRAGIKLLTGSSKSYRERALAGTPPTPPAPLPRGGRGERPDNAAERPRPALRAASVNSGARAAVRHWNSGIIYFQQGSRDKAAEEWRACLREDPANADCRSGLARLAAPSGAAAAAGEDVREAPAAKSGAARRAMADWNAGLVQFQQGDYKRARQSWEACLKADPGNLDCSTGLQRIRSSYGGAP